MEQERVIVLEKRVNSLLADFVMAEDNLKRLISCLGEAIELREESLNCDCPKGCGCSRLFLLIEGVIAGVKHRLSI